MPNKFKVFFTRSARKEIENLDVKFITRIWSSIEGLELNAYPVGTKKISGHKNLFRLREGDYRILYSIDDTAGRIDIIAIKHRKEAYRNL